EADTERDRGDARAIEAAEAEREPGERPDAGAEPAPRRRVEGARRPSHARLGRPRPLEKTNDEVAEAVPRRDDERRREGARGAFAGVRPARDTVAAERGEAGARRVGERVDLRPMLIEERHDQREHAGGESADGEGGGADGDTKRENTHCSVHCVARPAARPSGLRERIPRGRRHSVRYSETWESRPSTREDATCWSR